MHWVLDGYNVLRRDPDLRAREGESLEAGRAALLALVAGLARRTTDEFTVVFDGARRGGAPARPGRVQVQFSRPPESADDVLRRLAARLRERGVVVTSDRAVQTAARRAGAIAVSAEAFLAAAGSRPAREEPAADEEDEDDDEAGSSPSRRGPRHRLSREARAAARVLERLRER